MGSGVITIQVGSGVITIQVGSGVITIQVGSGVITIQVGSGVITIQVGSGVITIQVGSGVIYTMHYTLDTACVLVGFKPFFHKYFMENHKRVMFVKNKTFWTGLVYICSL